MTTIAVPPSLADALCRATGPIRLVDEQGKLLGKFSPAAAAIYASNELTAEELAELKRRVSSAGPWYSTDEMLAHLESRTP